MWRYSDSSLYIEFEDVLLKVQYIVLQHGHWRIAALLQCIIADDGESDYNHDHKYHRRLVAFDEHRLC